jgi:anti-sigma factor RsiW
LTCYLTRRRISAYVDGALEAAGAGAVDRHVARCARCSAEVDGLRKLQSRLRAVARPADPDWAGFWPGVVRGIEDAKHRRVVVPERSRWPRARWAYGGAVAAALLVTVTLWQFVPGPATPEASVIVRSAETAQPGSNVMVYSTPDKDLTVIWVFGLPKEGASAAE